MNGRRRPNWIEMRTSQSWRHYDGWWDSEGREAFQGYAGRVNAEPADPKGKVEQPILPRSGGFDFQGFRVFVIARLSPRRLHELTKIAGDAVRNCPLAVISAPDGSVAAEFAAGLLSEEKPLLAGFAGSAP